MTTERGTIYMLTSPVDFAGLVVTELKFREQIKMRDMRGLPMRETMLWDDAMTVAGRLCGQPDAFMGELSLLDGQSVWMLVAGFLADSPTTGEKP